ncbi:MAG: hypothetical protein ACRDWT_20865 [Jatrophihabitantaceae bacterium]
MRLSRLSILAAALALAGGLVVVALPGAASASSTAATKRIVLRPVSASGHVSTRYRQVADHHSGEIDCSATTVSTVAINSGIFACGPSAAYPVACWHAHASGHVLCYRNPFGKAVTNLWGYAPRHATYPREATAPFGIALDTGARCTIRDGGAWSAPKQHPSWVGYYSCGKYDVYASRSRARTSGIDESHRQWTVTTAACRGKLSTHKIVKAYFVGTLGR